MTDLLTIHDNTEELSSRMAQIDDILHCIAETHDDIADALFGVIKLVNSANELASETASMLSHLRNGSREAKQAHGVTPDGEESRVLVDLQGYLTDVNTLIDSRLTELSAQPDRGVNNG